jgi:hypothetical protein
MSASWLFVGAAALAVSLELGALIGGVVSTVVSHYLDRRLLSRLAELEQRLEALERGRKRRT